MLNIAVILGTTREGRRSEAPARYIFDKLSAREGVKAEFVDPREWNLKLNDDGARDFPLMQEIVERSDGFVIVAPEYNHGYPATLKFILDQVRPKTWQHRAVGVCSVSNGAFGGVRMNENLTNVFRELGIVHIKKDVIITKASEAFSEEGKPTDPELDERLGGFFDELIFMSTALKNMRG